MPWWMHRVYCWIFGHQWRETRRLPGTGHLTLFHPLAGADAVCDRGCHATWNDYEHVKAVRKKMFPELEDRDD